MESSSEKPRQRTSWIASLRPSTPRASTSRPSTPREKDSSLRLELQQLSRSSSVADSLASAGANTGASASTSGSSRSSPIAMSPSQLPAVTSGSSEGRLYDSPASPTPRRWSTVSAAGILTALSPSKNPRPIHELDEQASQLILNALERTNSAQQSSAPGQKGMDQSRPSGSFGKIAFNSMMGGFSALSLSRTGSNLSSANVNAASSNGDDKDEKRGRERSRSITRGLKPFRSSSAAVSESAADGGSRGGSRTRSQSPFSFGRFRQRELSPNPQPLALGSFDGDISDYSSSAHVRPNSAYTDDGESGDETVGQSTEGEGETEDEGWSEDDLFDPVTSRNTEKNALITPIPTADLDGALLDPDADVDPDPTGEGVNVVVPPEPYFPSSLNTYPAGDPSYVRGKRNPRRKKSTKGHEPLPLSTSRPLFQRDRCTITITQGDPQGKLGTRRKRRYIVASDLSEESQYALEWGIGTVIRDGDELMIVTVIENESRVDPPIGVTDRALKLKRQQERQGLAYILARQATSLLQRTKLNVTIVCQAWHTKNARHMLLDIVDHYEPTMLIVGSRGVGQLKGILLGSTSHYLTQKCSVPVMVARRRLRRPPRRAAHLAKHRRHVSLAEAGIDRVAAKVDQDVKVMRDEIERDDERRGPGRGATAMSAPEIEDEPEDGEGDDESPRGVKIAG